MTGGADLEVVHVFVVVDQNRSDRLGLRFAGPGVRGQDLGAGLECVDRHQGTGGGQHLGVRGETLLADQAGRGRAYGTNCIRYPLLRIDPAQRSSLQDIRDSLLARIAEAERGGWTGEAEGLKVSLAAANNNLAQADTAAVRRSAAIDLGIPAYRDIAATLSPGDS